jgi:hypothetical protein
MEVSLHQKIISELGNLLNQLTNGYSIPWDKIVYWQDLPTEYDRNWLTYRDTFIEFTDKNQLYDQKMTIEIQGWIFGEQPETDGTIALNDIIMVLGTNPTLSRCVNLLQLKNCTKECETGGKKVCSITLTIEVSYRVKSFRPN